MTVLRNRIEAVMRDEAAGAGGPLAAGLKLAAGVYGGIGRLRATLYRRGVLRPRKLPCPVIAVGNITVGGTGKTPMAVHVAGLLQGLGYRVAVISRGYRGLSEKSGGGVVSNGKRTLMTAAEAGDEPYLMALQLPGIPVIVGPKRYQAGCRALADFQTDILVLDDAYQHLQLARDLNLLLLDQAAPFGNGHVVPRGVLREPVSALARADAVIFTRAGATAGRHASSNFSRSELRPEVPVFRSDHRPYVYGIVPAGKRQRDAAPSGGAADGLAGQPVVAFSGIARNDDFFRTLSRWGAHIVKPLAYPDHHAYTKKDLDRILQIARQTGAERLVTTEKDFVRIQPRLDWPLPLMVVGVRIDFGDQAECFSAFIRRRAAGFFSGKE